jgi:excisionase family DNA binding protein
MTRQSDKGSSRTRLLTVAEVAEWTGLSPRYIWSLISSGRLTPIRFGRRATRVDEADVQAFIEAARRNAR